MKKEGSGRNLEQPPALSPRTLRVGHVACPKPAVGADASSLGVPEDHSIYSDFSLDFFFLYYAVLSRSKGKCILYTGFGFGMWFRSKNFVFRFHSRCPGLVGRQTAHFFTVFLHFISCFLDIHSCEPFLDLSHLALSPYSMARHRLLLLCGAALL